MTSADDLADDFELAPPDKLFMHHRRQLSAMLDGELSPDEAKFMLRRLEHDSELAACWERWQVCGDVLRGRGHALLPADFARRVARAIENGGEIEAEPVASPQRPRTARWGGRAALAASVAVVALFVARQLPGDVAPAAADAPSDLFATAPEPATPPSGPPAVTDPNPDPSFEQTATALAATAAVSELPRRASERRSRAQSQRAASRVQQRIAQQQAPVRVAGSQTAPVAPPLFLAPHALPGSGNTDPFAAQAVTPPRPWPRAILPALATGGSLAASYGSGGAATTAFHPFEPRLLPPGPGAVTADADGGAAMPASAESGSRETGADTSDRDAPSTDTPSTDTP
jgi:negative regulator of sigma E activity